ncbi:hypothetical protein [Leptolyngbya sp. FACHB-321]|nr:hypothetical protein [Leptolyngbya sp. FACHB-321]
MPREPDSLAGVVCEAAQRAPIALPAVAASVLLGNRQFLGND